MVKNSDIREGLEHAMQALRAERSRIDEEIGTLERMMARFGDPAPTAAESVPPTPRIVRDEPKPPRKSPKREKNRMMRGSGTWRAAMFICETFATRPDTDTQAIPSLALVESYMGVEPRPGAAGALYEAIRVLSARRLLNIEWHEGQAHGDKTVKMQRVGCPNTADLGEFLASCRAPATEVPA